MTNKIECPDSFTNKNNSLYSPVKEIESFCNVNPGNVCLIKNESNPNSAVFLIQGETFLGEPNPSAYKCTISQENISKLPILTTEMIKHYKVDTEYNYSFHKYSAFDHQIIWRQCTDMDYGRGRDIQFKPFLLEEKLTNPDRVNL